METKLKFILSILCSVLFFSCEGPEPITEPEDDVTLKAEPSLLTFSDQGGSKTFNIRSNASAWTISKSDADWVTIDPMTGSGDGIITVSAPKNEGARRSTVISINAEGAKKVEVTIAQDKVVEPELVTRIYTDPETPDADGPCILYFSAGKGSPFHNKNHDLYAHIGINEWDKVQAGWEENTDRCKFQKTDVRNIWKLEITPSIREWFGFEDEELFRICCVVRNSDCSAQSSDMFHAVKDNKFGFKADPVVEEAIPAGVHHGINYNADGSVTFVFYDKDREDNHYDWCYLIGEFNGWERVGEYAMKRDNQACCWWITCEGFDTGREYLFQYMIGDEDDRMRLSDPYAEIVYSGDDKWIPSSTYPELREYPSETAGYVSAFEIGRNSYNWQVPDFKIEDRNDLIIYELLLRDFTENGGKEGNLKNAMAKLDYLETLGVNAIELMPIQEFDGNDSWGYNPNHYFAMDKAYGTREMYKEFIDECHRRGIAVFVDVVYNHLTGNNAFDKMYPMSINPFFNETAPHPYSVFEDIDHENEVIVNHIKRSLGYLLEEYNIDGFRFDLTKGFTNNSSTESTASNYDADRVRILKGYNDYIRSVSPDAVVILEHFCCDQEEKELGEAGMKVWRNLNYAYGQAAQGTKSKSSFNDLWTGSTGMKFGGYVGFMESHDEERNAFRQKTYGEAGVKGDLAVMMQRQELNSAFFLTVPGPKMIWQFGELGYDISIEENGRTGRKAPHWEYLDVPERKALYDTYCDLIGFRKDNPEFFDEGASFSWKVSSNDWDEGRFITCTAGSKSFVVVGNFATSAKTLTVTMPSDGTWKNYFDSSETYDGGSLSIELPAGEFRLLTDF